MQHVYTSGDLLRADSSSGNSDLDAMENETDTLGRAIIKHERDARRIQAVLHSTSRPFSRAIPRASVSQRLQRVSALDRDLQRKGERATSQDREEQKVAPSTARTWGRRQPPERNWTRHTDAPQDKPGVNLSSRTGYIRSRASIDDVAEEEDGDDDDDDDDDDAIVTHRTAFTGDHLDRHARFASALGEDTPPSMKRNRPGSEPSSLRHMNSTILDDMSSRDVFANEVAPKIEYAKESSVSRRMLIEKPSADYVSVQSQRNLQRAAANSESLQYTFDEDKENVPKGSKSSSNRATDSHSARGHSHAAGRDAQAPSDSLQLLQRLARATSASPNSARTIDMRRQPFASGISQIPATTDRGTAKNKTANVTQRTEQTQDVPETPVILGGWVDTPKQDDKAALGVSSDHSSKQAPIPEQLAKAEVSNEVSIDKAIAERLKDFHNDRQPTSQGLSTAGNSGLDLTTSLTGSRPTDSVQQDEAPTAPKQIATRSSLRPGTNIAPSLSSQSQYRQRDLARPSKQVSFDLNHRTICEHCGGGYVNIWDALWVELRSNFYVRDFDSYSGVRLTWLGAAVLAWLCWYLLENMLCKWYCKPMFAYSMHGYGVGAWNPRYPLVIPSLLLHPFDSALQPVAKWTAWLSGVTFHWIFGEGARDYSIPAQLPQRTASMRALSDGATIAAKSLQPASWAEAAATVGTAVSQRAMASAVGAIDDMEQFWNRDVFG